MEILPVTYGGHVMKHGVVSGQREHFFRVCIPKIVTATVHEALKLCKKLLNVRLNCPSDDGVSNRLHEQPTNCRFPLHDSRNLTIMMSFIPNYFFHKCSLTACPIIIWRKV